MGPTHYAQALKSAIPAQYLNGLQDLPPPTIQLLDTILRFTSGGECPEDAAAETKEGWKTAQDVLRKAFDGLKQSGSNGSAKRSREDEPDAEDHAAKKSRTSTTTEDITASSPSQDDDTPLYTLHALSLQAPLRKKLDIVLYKHSLRLVNPSTQAVEALIPSSSLKRAFLLNTRGKTKAHWTVVILASDTVAPKVTGKAAQAAAAAAAANGEVKAEERQIVFGIDATPPAYAVTDHITTPSSRTLHPKGTPVLPQLRAFLANLPIPYTEPDTTIFRSAVSGSGGEAIAGVEAYRAAKEGTLWFLDDGILWDGRPCEYWSIADLLPGEGDDGIGSEAVRFVSATGKTGSVFIRRRIPRQTSDASGNDEDQEDDEDKEEEYAEVAFNPVDVKEKDAIMRWVKKRKHLFGVAPNHAGSADHSESSDVKGKGKAVEGEVPVDLKGKGKAVALPEEDTDDSDDEDFVASESDDGSVSSSGDSDSDGDGSNTGDESEDIGSEASDEEDGADGVEEGDDEGGDDDADDEETMDPKHHPLLRPGAMPRMSKAAMGMAIGMLNEDLFAAGSSAGSGSSSSRQEGGSSSVRKAPKKAESVESEEEDELDD